MWILTTGIAMSGLVFLTTLMRRLGDPIRPVRLTTGRGTVIDGSPSDISEDHARTI
jgi:hypothetical protein